MNFYSSGSIGKPVGLFTETACSFVLPIPQRKPPLCWGPTFGLLPIMFGRETGKATSHCRPWTTPSLSP
jgi:hypothetical protein